MPYPTKSIANLVLNRAGLAGQKLRPLKLQKLLYYVAGYYAAVTSKPLFDRAIEAWEYGPVVPEIYQEFKEFGSNEITRPAMAVDFKSGSLVPCPIPTDDPRLNKILDFVWDNYGQYSGTTLSQMTHRPDSPWKKAIERHPGIRGPDIEFDSLKDYFSTLVRKHAA